MHKKMMLTANKVLLACKVPWFNCLALLCKNLLTLFASLLHQRHDCWWITHYRGRQHNQVLWPQLKWERALKIRLNTPLEVTYVFQTEKPQSLPLVTLGQLMGQVIPDLWKTIPNLKKTKKHSTCTEDVQGLTCSLWKNPQIKNSNENILTNII